MIHCAAAVMLAIGLAFAACDRGKAPEPEHAAPRPGSGAEREGSGTVDPGPAPEPPADASRSPRSDGWTAGIVRGEGIRDDVAFLREVRIARHEGFDRAVWEFVGEGLPGYSIEYVDEPVRACGSGRTVEIAGDGWLEVRFELARGHTETGDLPPGLAESDPGHPTILQARRTCDFEGVVTWVLGVRAPEPYRALELGDPTRLVVDVRH